MVLVNILNLSGDVKITFITTSLLNNAAKSSENLKDLLGLLAVPNQSDLAISFLSLFNSVQ